MVGDSGEQIQYKAREKKSLAGYDCLTWLVCSCLPSTRPLSTSWNRMMDCCNNGRVTPALAIPTGDSAEDEYTRTRACASYAMTLSETACTLCTCSKTKPAARKDDCMALQAASVVGKFAIVIFNANLQTPEARRLKLDK